MKALGGPEPQYKGTANGQADSLANHVGGPDLALRRLEIDEARDIAKYGQQLKALGDETSIAILDEVIADEREHYVTLGNLIRSEALCQRYHLSRLKRLWKISCLPAIRDIHRLRQFVLQGDIADGKPSASKMLACRGKEARPNPAPDRFCSE